MVNYNPFVSQRRTHMQQVLKLFETFPEMDKETMIAKFCVQTGLKRETVRGMVTELEDAGFFDRVEKEIKKDGRRRNIKTNHKKPNKKAKRSRK